MRRFVRALIPAFLGSLLLAATASANPSAPASPVTRQLPGVSCSVTASFTLDAVRGTMSYGGGVSCAGGVGQKTIDVVPQVFNVVNGTPLWFNLSLAGRYQGPTPISPLRLSDTAGYVPSHTYRLLVYGRVSMPGGRSAASTACSGKCNGSPSLTIGSSYRYAAQPSSSAPVRGTHCAVGQNGLVFTLVNGSYVINYGGYSACSGAEKSAKRSLTISVQVANRSGGKDVWFTISGSSLSTGPGTANPLQLSTGRTGHLGHAYRIAATTTVGTRSATVYSASAAP